MIAVVQPLCLLIDRAFDSLESGMVSLSDECEWPRLYWAMLISGCAALAMTGIAVKLNIL